MKEERDFIRQVKSAREDMQEADELIRTYMPFIKSRNCKILRRPVTEGQDDETEYSHDRLS